MRVSCALIESCNQVLIAQKGLETSLPSLWEFPGGKIEPHESPEACIIREINEELGVKIKTLELLPITTYNYPDFSLELHPFRCQIIEGNPRPIEHLQIRWTHPKQLKSLSFAPGDIETLNHYLHFFIHRPQDHSEGGLSCTD
jgi:8-oxo-dGTP diphosphatase